MVRAGAVCHTPVCSQDFFPTICEAVGAPLPDDRIIDGFSLMPLLRGTGDLKRKTLYWHFPHYWWGGRLRPYSVIRHRDWKLIRHYEDERLELFHIGDDIAEEEDLAAEMPGKTQELKALLDAWLREVRAKMTRPNPEYKGHGK